MPDSPRSDSRARPPVWAPFGWAAILTLILAAAIFLTDNLHSLPSHIGEVFESVLFLPAALVFVLLRVPGDFLSWLSGVPDWLLSTVQTLDAYFYSLVLTIPIWIIMRLKRRIDSKRPV